MSKKNIIYILFLCFFIFSGCTKQNKNILPPLTASPRLELGVKVKSIVADSFLDFLPSSEVNKELVLLITKVKPKTNAAYLGLKENDMIYKINGQRVTGISDSYAVMAKIKNSPVLDVELVRTGQPMKLSIKLRDKY